MVKQRIYIPCATDNWPMQVRPLPEAPPDHFGQIDFMSQKLDDDGPNYQGQSLYPVPLAGRKPRETVSHSRSM